MSIKAVLFDLDGTLLPMDQDEFTKGYFKLLAQKLVPYGYDTEELVNAVWKGTAEMVRNDGSESNETVFWRTFSNILGERILRDRAVIEEFYQNEFEGAKTFCGYNEDAVSAVKEVKEMGLRAALASNPVFPMTAMKARVRWAGLEPNEFEIITAYENIGVSKPNPAYYSGIAALLGVAPEDCLMVGNDVEEDMVAQECSMSVFLLTDNLINKKDSDITLYTKGGFPSLIDYMKDKIMER